MTAVQNDYFVLRLREVGEFQDVIHRNAFVVLLEIWRHDVATETIDETVSREIQKSNVRISREQTLDFASKRSPCDGFAWRCFQLYCKIG